VPGPLQRECILSQNAFFFSFFSFSFFLFSFLSGLPQREFILSQKASESVERADGVHAHSGGAGLSQNVFSYSAVVNVFSHISENVFSSMIECVLC
jgi:hypothetical protein